MGARFFIHQVASSHYDTRTCAGSEMTRWPLKGQLVQGYLVHQKTPAPRTLLPAYAEDPTVVPGGGHFLIGEVLPVSNILRCRAAAAVELVSTVSGRAYLGENKTSFTGVPRS